MPDDLQIPTPVTTPAKSEVLTQTDNRARFWLAFTVIVQFVALVSYLTYTKANLPDSQLILGAEITFVSTVLGYYYGSSSGSAAKQAQLQEKKQ